jgi:hypothetical protein
MPELLYELREEHEMILDGLNEIVALDISSKEAEDAIQGIKAGLLAHLKKEDEFLYPAMIEAAKERKALRRLLESAQKDMAAITSFAFKFFDKYSSGGSGPEFEGDFKLLNATVRNRILHEESIIFEEYEGLHTKRTRRPETGGNA